MVGAGDAEKAPGPAASGRSRRAGLWWPLRGFIPIGCEATETLRRRGQVGGLSVRLITGLLVSLSFVLLGPAQRSEAQQASGPQTALSGLSAQPDIAPAPDWVAPVDFPVDSSNGDEAPYRILLHDQQVSLEPGRRTTYSEVVIRIQTPAGLAAGNLLFPWRPATDVLTVHKVQILRGDRVIDVLESGQTFTVIRREQNLENAILDGVLTAIMQPEGLQVGDTWRSPRPSLRAIRCWESMSSNSARPGTWRPSRERISACNGPKPCASAIG